MTSSGETLDVVVGAFVAELAGAGVRHVCACPGSRSTPLAITLAHHADIRLWMHLDERSAGYFGLGLARATRQPVALLATSGTAAANFLPAVVEASLARVPLVVLTADRPHELRDNGAAQTIDQLHLYGKHVKWFFDLPEPARGDEQLRLVRSLAARAVSTATAQPAGPVHLNWPLREPLLPSPSNIEQAASPRIRVHNPRLEPSHELVTQLAGDFTQLERGLIVVGPQDDPELAEALSTLAARLGYPVLGDALSGVRCGPHDRSLVIDTYDAFLRARQQPSPEVVLRIGAIPTSKPLQQYIEGTRQVLVDPGGWRDPFNSATDVLHVDPVALCRAFAAELPERGDNEWAAEWIALNQRTRRSLDAHLAQLDEVFEGKVLPMLANALPDGAIVYAGNSMPVRDLDTFLPASPRALRCLSNRGANGIDGVVSSALGASAAGLGPTALVIGDVSFYHDLNGLLAAHKYALELLVVLINNDGGGIFSFLPQAADESAYHSDFERLFGTPHGLSFRPFVEGYGGRFTRVVDWSSFSSAVDTGLERGGLQVVEVCTDRQRNVAQHRAVWRAVVEALAPTPVG